jgi:hypothetical protein
LIIGAHPFRHGIGLALDVQSASDVPIRNRQ